MNDDETDATDETGDAELLQVVMDRVESHRSLMQESEVNAIDGSARGANLECDLITSLGSGEVDFVQGSVISSECDDVSESSSVQIEEHYASNPLPVSCAGHLESAEGQEDDNSVAPVKAVPVNECDLEKSIRERIIDEAVQAYVVQTGEQAGDVVEKNEKRSSTSCLLLLFTSIVIALILGVLLPLFQRRGNSSLNSDNEDSITHARTLSPSEIWIPTIEKVRERGFLRCGVYLLEENVDWWVCQAVSAAIFGEPKVEYVRGNQLANFDRLRNHTIDLVASAGVSWDRIAIQDIVFPFPPIFDGVGFSGVPKYVHCAEDNLSNVQECSGLKLCAFPGSPAQEMFQERLPSSQYLLFDTFQASLQSFFGGGCNLISGNSFARSEYLIRKFGYEGEYYFGKSLITKTPYSPASRADDPEFADFVKMVLQSLVLAEHLNVTHENVEGTLHKTSLFGVGHENMFIDAIRAVGNFGKAYEDAFPVGLPRGSLEQWNNGSSGLLHAFDLGNPDEIGPPPLPGGSLERILERGSLRCGIYLRGPGFSQNQNGRYNGLDIEYCKALSAGLFHGRVDAVEFVELINETDGFMQISNGNLDVIAGAAWNLQNDVHEPTTEVGYSFSIPYYYGFHKSWDRKNGTQNIEGENLCLLTSEEDYQWTSFVEGIVLALVYAEEKGVAQRRANDMPEVSWYGIGFERIFRDTIFAVGNYGEIYEREVSEYIPRGGRNMLNDFASPGPQLYVPSDLLRLIEV